MRRMLMVVMAGIEMIAAMVLIVIALRLPGAFEVEETVGRIEKVSHNAGRQVRGLSTQIGKVRKRQPELAKIARKLETQMRRVSADVQTRSLNGDGLVTVSESLGQIAEGLDGLSHTLAPTGVEEIGKGLTGTADYLEGKVLPAASKAAGALEKATAGLKADSGKLSAAFKENPLELKAGKALVDSLTRIEEALARLSKVGNIENFEAMREGFKGLEASLDGGATQVEKWSKQTLPKIDLKAFMVKVEEKEFWPEGKNIAAGMRKGAKGCQAAGKEMDALTKELPKLHKSLERSKAVVRSSREALTSALSQQEKVEPLLKRLSGQLVLLAEELPKLTGDMAKVLRETGQLKEVAQALRQAEKSMNRASANWPHLRKGLERSASLLRATRQQMDGALVHREKYEQTLDQTVELSKIFSESLPVMLEEVDSGLEQQESSLGELSDSIAQVSASLPEMGNSATQLLATTRMFLGLFAAVLAVHAVIVWSGSRDRAAMA